MAPSLGLQESSVQQTKASECQKKQAAMADEVQHDELISQFVGITGADSERGKFYLESANWNVEVAIASFFETIDEQNEPPPELLPQIDEPVEPSRQTPNLFTPPEPTPSPSLGFMDRSSSSGSKKSKPVRHPGGIATLNSLRENEADSDEEEGQRFYAGGSERSGQEVIGPGRRKDPDQVVSDMFKAAREHGGQVVESDENRGASSSSFGGQGQRLGSEPGASSAAPVTSSAPQASRPRDMILRLWRNGFTVDDGELRAFEDPANAEFLMSIKAGNIPRELVALANGGEVSLNMEDHRHEDYVAQKKKAKPFTGEGHRLGSVAPTLDTPAAPLAKADEDEAAKDLKVDESKPVTSIQIRLADSTK